MKLLKRGSIGYHEEDREGAKRIEHVQRNVGSRGNHTRAGLGIKCRVLLLALFAPHPVVAAARVLP